MAISHDLQTSGVLHGANFTAWRDCTMATLRLQSLDPYVDDSIEDSTKTTTHSRNESKASAVASYLTMVVKPELLECIPDSEQSDPGVLMRRLEALRTQFRFLGLPPELRNMVYKYIFANAGRVFIDATGEPAPSYPAITAVSRQIRSEVLPLFYSTAKFEIWLDKGSGVADAARLWVLNVVREHIKHIGEITIELDVREQQSRRRRIQSIR